MQNIEITKLILENFRNFKTKTLTFSSRLVLFSGKNGVGKTNILEALTLFGKNQNLRGIDFDEMLATNYESQEKQQSFSLFCEISNHDFIEKIGISYNQNGKKNLLINGENVASKKNSDTKNWLPNFIWLTPQLELLLISGKSGRREFLDKIVGDIDFSHNARVNNYQKSLKERLLILQKTQNHNQEKWLEIVESKIAELGTSIALARNEAVEFFNKAINSFESNFPKSQLKIIDEISLCGAQNNALQIEELYKTRLKTNRQIDKESFKTNFGVHRSDFSAIFLDKNSAANYASTGEQKSIMIGIILARAKISASYKNQPTILIFDEIMSHLDEKKKFDLLDEVKRTNLQCFFSATSSALIPQSFLDKNLIQIVEV